MRGRKSPRVERPVRLSLTSESGLNFHPTDNLFRLKLALHKQSQQLVDTGRPNNWVAKARAKRRTLVQQNTKPWTNVEHQPSATANTVNPQSGSDLQGSNTNVLKVGHYAQAWEKLSQAADTSGEDELINTVFHFAAQARGVSPEDLRQEMDEEIALTVRRLSNDHPIVEDAKNAAAAGGGDVDSHIRRRLMLTQAATMAAAELQSPTTAQLIDHIAYSYGAAEGAASGSAMVSRISDAQEASAADSLLNTLVSFVPSIVGDIGVMGAGLAYGEFVAQDRQHGTGMSRRAGRAHSQVIQDFGRQAVNELTAGAIRGTTLRVNDELKNAKALGDREQQKQLQQQLEQLQSEYAESQVNLLESWNSVVRHIDGGDAPSVINELAGDATSLVVEGVRSGTLRASIAQFGGTMRSGMGNRAVSLLSNGTLTFLQMAENSPSEGFLRDGLVEAIKSPEFAAAAGQMGVNMAGTFVAARAQGAYSPLGHDHSPTHRRGRAAQRSVRRSGGGFWRGVAAKGAYLGRAAMALPSLGTSLAVETGARNLVEPLHWGVSLLYAGGNEDVREAVLDDYMESRIARQYEMLSQPSGQRRGLRGLIGDRAFNLVTAVNPALRVIGQHSPTDIIRGRALMDGIAGDDGREEAMAILQDQQQQQQQYFESQNLRAISSAISADDMQRDARAQDIINRLDTNTGRLKDGDASNYIEGTAQHIAGLMAEDAGRSAADYQDYLAGAQRLAFGFLVSDNPSMDGIQSFADVKDFVSNDRAFGRRADDLMSIVVNPTARANLGRYMRDTLHNPTVDGVDDDAFFADAAEAVTRVKRDERAAAASQRQQAHEQRLATLRQKGRDVHRVHEENQAQLEDWRQQEAQRRQGERDTHQAEIDKLRNQINASRARTGQPAWGQEGDPTQMRQEERRNLNEWAGQVRNRHDQSAQRRHFGESLAERRDRRRTHDQQANSQQYKQVAGQFDNMIQPNKA